MIRAEAPCSVCGTRLVSRWTEDGRDWLPWQDDAGSTIGGRTESWVELLARLAVQNVAAYSALSAVHALGGALMPGEHLHAAEALQSDAGTVPECCGWPMRRTRDGWQCRCDEGHTLAA